MDRLQLYNGYEAGECKSLTEKLLRCHKVVKDGAERIYWYDALKNGIVKEPRPLLESLVKDHGSVPTSIISKVKTFSDDRQFLRDHYEAIKLMDTIGSLPVDRNVSRLYARAMRDDGHDIMNSKLKCENNKDGGRAALRQFEEILEGCDKALSEETARRLAKQVLRVDQASTLFGYNGLDSVWRLLSEHVKRVGVDDDLDQRFCLIYETRKLVKKWRKMDLMLVLWAIYSLMDLVKLPEPTEILYETVVTKTLNSRNKMERLAMPPFAVDATTVRGRTCVDTKEKLMNDDKMKNEITKEKLLQKYSPIEASHGPSPHDTCQKMIDCKKLIEECERRHRSDLVPVLFVMPSHLEGNEDAEGEEKVQGCIEVDEQFLQKLQKPHWRTVMLNAASEVFDEELMGTLPKAESGTRVLDFDKKVSYEGPVKPLKALQNLAVSVVGREVAKLESIPRVRILLDATKNNIYLEKQLIGTPLSDDDRMAVGNNRVKLQQRELIQASNQEAMYLLTGQNGLLTIKTLIFRRLMGLPCNFSQLRVHVPTKDVYMTNLCCSGKDDKIFCRIQPKKEADWLVDSSRFQGLINELSQALRNDDLLVKLVTWLIKLGKQPAFETILGTELCNYIIQFQSFQRNLEKVVDVFGVIPETDNDDDDDDEDEEEEEEE